MADDDPCLELQPIPESVADARRFMRAVIGPSDDLDVPVETLILAANELVTNAVLHARTPFRITVRRPRPNVIAIDVLDGNSRLPRSAETTADATSGRGLALIEALGLRWGVEPHPTGKIVWVRTR